MVTDVDERTPRPSPAETLAGEYPDWLIYREYNSGRHGDWVAARRGELARELRAATVAELAELLGAAP